MLISLQEYRNMTVKEFIKEIENQETWDMTDPEVYREALEEYDLDYDTYDDPDRMWSDFLEKVEK